MVSTNSTLTRFNPRQYIQKLLPSRRRVKTPTLLQMEAVECGAAALGIIMYYLGRIVPLPELRRECGVSRDGSKASNMLKAARRYGLEAKGFKKELTQLRELPLPYIVFWNFNHFLVVEGWGKEKVYLNDPASGPCTISLQEFDEAYTGVVLVMQPGEEFKRGGRKTSMVLALWSRLKGTTGALAYCLLAGFLLTLVGLVVPVFTQIFVDEILIQGRQQWLRPLLLAMAIAAILQGALTLLRLRYLRRLKIKLAVGMSSRFLWHILRLPISFYAQRFAGEISNRTSLNDQVADILSGQLASTVIDTVMLGFYVIVMSQYDWALTAIVVSFALINVITLQSISRQRKDANQRLIQDYGKAAGASIAALQSIETLKASGLESDFFARWSGYYTKAINSQQELGVTNQTLSVLPVLLSALSAAFLLAVGGLRVMDGHLSIGMLIAFQGMMQNFQQPVDSLVSFGRTLQELDGNLIRLDDVLDNPTDPQLEHRSEDQSSPTFTPKLAGHLELKNLTFGYSRLETPLIENFNLKVKPGQRIALVGGSGSGKSTVAKMVSGLYESWSGEILLDGKPKSEIPTQLLTNSLAMVEQDILMFEGTVRDNLTLWDTTVPDKYIKQACRDAAIDDVIQSLPGGYNAKLAEGAANLSGGQRQRLEIARALVNNPSILIMDEATSALDSETEKIVDRNLRRRGCTCLIVAHRLSTIRDCDEIIVLDRGKVVQRGTHEELWQQEGVYARLIKSGEG
ncbi:NHLP family bacteriocin export ABC transporter peptidase/permease/ATPase subunit [Pleurocapsa sp. FMAR1]|uniref:NHLP family bacteriocin export ABC transporter peptidase/permease/ATPase subunit n=1 Tax=Pleurocapsa sp. FMAR1 TaxID=3040204 RepID=UPI0029C8E600|nr:NHLP family bacteriocin export ABC transporter peptidase/permease/ATPase subunit [Pleurocapsa sp. FMAR1]